MVKTTQISLFDKDDSFWQIKKASGIVQMGGLATLLERKIMDVSIWFAKSQLKTNPEQRKFTCELGLFKRLVGCKDNDNTALKEGFTSVRRTEYEYNILHKDSEKRGNLSYFSDVEIEVNGRGKQSFVSWWYPERILNVVKNPRIYAILNLLILAGLNSKHGYILYGFLKDYIKLKKIDVPYD